MRTHVDGASVGSKGDASTTSSLFAPGVSSGPAQPPIDLKTARVHLIGIGGAGMSGAASLLLNLGAKVTGSDQIPFDGMGILVEKGALVSVGHRAGQLDPSVDCVVISAAIGESNPELLAARAGGLLVLKYAELAGALMRQHEHGVAIAGTHGKSTTTAMCVHLCREAGLDPSFLLGARSSQLGGGSGIGTGKHFIVEACEFDRSFLHLAPDAAAILNVELDHLDCYGDLDDIIEAFNRFSRSIRPDGYLVCHAEDQTALRVMAGCSANVESIGFTDRADWQAVNLREERGCFSFDVLHHDEAIGETRLSVPGRYNVSNALAAIALAHHAGADLESVAQALPTFGGIDRRMTWRGAAGGVTLVDDYAHHPTEIRVTLEAAKRRYEPKRTWVVFQPHQAARTRHLMDGFAEALTVVDETIVLDAFGAREQAEDDEGRGEVSSSEKLAQRIRRNGGEAQYMQDSGMAARHVVQNVLPGDLVITMGAGDVWKVADELVEQICRPH